MIKKNLYLTKDVNDGLKQLSLETGETESAIMREALRSYLKKVQKQK